MKIGFGASALLLCGFNVLPAADPGELWAEALQAKGGRERLAQVHSLAVYLRPAPVNLQGPPSNLLLALPGRYFEYVGGSSGNRHAMIVNLASGHAARDENGLPPSAWQPTARDRDRFTIFQVLYLLRTVSLEPRPVAAKGRDLTVQAGDRTFRLSLNRAGLVQRLQVVKLPGIKHQEQYDYHLDRYREWQQIMLPQRVTWLDGLREWIWDADYDVNETYNPKFFDRMPDLADGPEPWRRR